MKNISPATEIVLANPVLSYNNVLNVLVADGRLFPPMPTNVSIIDADV